MNKAAAAPSRNAEMKTDFAPSRNDRDEGVDFVPSRSDRMNKARRFIAGYGGDDRTVL